MPHYAPDGPDAVRAIRAAGGVPVFAHPGADARGRIVPDRVFDQLAAAGLGGIEVDHRDHSPAQRERLTAIARPARAAGDRVERLPRRREGQPAGGEPDRARGARGDRGAGDDGRGPAMSDVFDAYLFASVFITLFVIMDPPGVVPIFLGLTGAMTRQQRNRAARQAVLVALGVIVAFALFGQSLLDYMHITLPALQASGGLLLLLIAMELLTGKMEEPQPSGNGKVNVALVPLGTPLLAGPGAIVATMVFVQQSDKTVADWVAIALGVVAVHVCLYLAMRFANVIHRVLGDSGTILVTRIAGLLLAAIAVQLVADAVEAFIKAA